MDFLNAYELPILHALHDRFACSFCDIFFPLFTHLGDAGIVWILLTLALLCFRKTRRAGASMALALLLGLLLGNVCLKPLLNRTRPYLADPTIRLLISAESDPSFPSGHVLSSFAAAVSLVLRHRRAGWAAVTAAVLIAFSRLYCMVHYPTDVLGGAILGILLGYAACRIVDRIPKRDSFPETEKKP